MSVVRATARRSANGEGSRPSQRADGRWQVHVRYTDADGAPKRTTVYGKTQKEVTAKRRELVKRLADGKPATDAKLILATYVETWIAGPLAASDRKPNTRAMYATVARKHIAGRALGRAALDKVKPSTVESWVVELRQAGLSQSTVRSVYTVLRAILDSAVRDGLLATNPAAVVKRPKVDHHEAAFLTPGQVRALLAAAEGSRYAPLFQLLVNTGLRRGEALALTWRDVDLEEGLLRVRGTLARVDGLLAVTPPKTAKSRRAVPLSPSVVELLKAQRQRQRLERAVAGSQWAGSEYVFTTELGEPCDPRNALRALKAAAAKHNRAVVKEGRTGDRLPDVGLHSLRHSAASVMLTNGVPLMVVGDILGHASVAITGDIYGHVAPDVSREAMAKLGAALG